VRTARTFVAAVAIAALVAVFALVAFAAPGAVAQVASPSASAARAEYCPPEELKARKDALKAFQKTMLAKRKAYFKKHPKGKDRAAFVKKQNNELKRLKRELANCD
jgi:hypothetical protein